MDPSDTFESFDMNNFDDFLARESFEDEEVSNSAGSSFSDSFDMMPVYRSLDVMPAELLQPESLSGIDQVFEAPVLSRHRTPQSAPAQPVDELFAMLEADFTNTSLPRQSDVLCGIAQSTSVVVASGLSALTASLMSFFQSRGVQHEHCAASSLWKCEVTDFVHSCQFRVQVYSEEEEGPEVDGVTEYTVEFLRTSGCPLLFSAQFQAFAAEKCPAENKAEAVCAPAPVCVAVSGLAPKAMADQQALESFVSWAAADRAEATRAVCGLLAGQGAGAGPSSALTRSDQLSAEGILVMTLLGTLCMQHKELDAAAAGKAPAGDCAAESSLPMLSLLRQLLQTRAESDLHPTSRAVLTAMVDSLLPATARLTADSSQASACERDAAVQLMEISSTW